MLKIRLALTTLAALAMLGCTNMTAQQQGTVSGAAIGAAGGAGIAAIAGGSGWTGAAVGAVVGGTIGHIKGKQQQQ